MDKRIEKPLIEELAEDFKNVMFYLLVPMLCAFAVTSVIFDITQQVRRSPQFNFTFFAVMAVAAAIIALIRKSANRHIG